MASKNYARYVMVRLHPANRGLDSWRDGDITLTHEPVALTRSEAEKVLQLRWKGRPLAQEYTVAKQADDAATAVKPEPLRLADLVDSTSDNDGAAVDEAANEER